MFQTFNTVSPSDRFIPRRSDADLEASYYLLNEKPPSPEHYSYKNSEYVDYAYLDWKQRMYQERLWSLVAPKSTRILNITETSQTKTSSGIKPQHWPVRSRKRPLIGSPFMILDMPGLKESICQNIIDWSFKQYMASIYEKEVYFWRPDKYGPDQGTDTNGRVANCLRWNHLSTHLAIALDDQGISTSDLSKKKLSCESLCPCSTKCIVTALAWSSNDLLLSGCALGRLTVWNMQMQILKTVYNAHNSLIITINLSCQERYLATTSTDSAVRIWIWPDIKAYFEITHFSPVRGIAWHPWKDSLLAIGGYSHTGCITLWNVNNQDQVGYKEPPAVASSVDALTWNALTGELVVSYWVQSEHSSTGGHNSINVLSNLNTIVDSSCWHDGRVLYLLWGDDGTRLATAGTDESLCIWNYFGNSKETIKTYESIKKKRNFSENNFENLLLFGKTIR